MTIASLATSNAVDPSCEQPPKRQQNDDKIVESHLDEPVDLTYSSCYDTYDESTQFFYFSSERPSPTPITPLKSVEVKPEKKLGLSKRQWMVIATFILINFSGATCVSLQAPFYPAEAERKGISASEYGFVFGVFELVVFIVSPLYGKYISKIGTNFLVLAGTFLTSNSCILFGMLDKVQNRDAFLTLSFLVRVVEAIGQAGYLTGSFTIIAREFPSKVATMFAMLEAAYGVGLFIGPTFGGYLFEIGGYNLPFLLTGLLLLFSTGVSYFILPAEDRTTKNSGLGMLRLLTVPTVAIAGYLTICASFSIGFLVAVLEPHLRQFNLSPAQMGSMFIVSGGLYAITTPFWGRISETVISPCAACGYGGVVLCISYLLIGPSPLLQFNTILWVCVIGLTLHGFGVAGELVGSFGLAHKGAVKWGFPDNTETYGLVSGYWTSLFAFGAFLGPSIGGILMDAVGFEMGSQLVLCLHMIAVMVTVLWLCKERQNDCCLSRLEHGETEEKIPLVH